MDPFHALSEDNHAQIRKYLRFFRQKKEACLRAVRREFDDARQERLVEPMLSRQEAIELIDFLDNAIHVQVKREASLKLCGIK